MQRKLRTFLVALVLVLGLVLVTACGARLSTSDRLAAIGTGAVQPSAAASAAPGQPTTGSVGQPAGGQIPGSTGVTGSGPQAPGSGPVVGPSSGPGPTTGPTTPTSSRNAQTCSATSKNNGGKTDTGVSATQINVSNISDISGPVPGLFKSAEQAAYAFVAYFNSTHPDGVCGRQLRLLPKDSSTDSGTNRQQTLNACHDSFAAVGNMSAFDDGGAQPVRQCGLVDISATMVTSQRQNNAGSYGANGQTRSAVSNAVPLYFKQNFGSAVQHAAFLYIDAGASAQNAQSDISVWSKTGWKFVYTAGLPVQNASTQGFKPYVQKMRDKGVQVVEWIGAYQEAASLAEAMQESDFHPKVFLLDPTGYNPGYVQQAGGAAEGTYLYDDAVPLSSVGKNAELTLYAQWLQRTGVSDPPTYFGQYAWSAMRLFTDLLFKVGPHPTRKAMNAQLAKVHAWTGNGMHPASDVGGKRGSACEQFYRVRNGKFEAITRHYFCGRLVAP